MSDKGTIVSTTAGTGVAGYGFFADINWAAAIGATVAILSLLINWYYKRKQHQLRVKADERQELRFQWEREQAEQQAWREAQEAKQNGINKV